MSESENFNKIQTWITKMKDLSYSAFPPLSQEISTTWIKDHSNNDTHRKIIHFKGNLNSSGEFTCQNGDYFEGQFFGSVGDRSGHLTKPRESGCFTVGLWKSGLLEGIVDMETEGGGWKRAAFKQGLRHGLERSFEGPYAAPGYQLKRVACYQDDQIVGPVWQFLPGNAFLLGPVEESNEGTEEFVGKSVLFIYPDCQTAICGRFAHGTFISGYTSTIENIDISGIDYDTTFLPQISISPQKLGPLVKRDVSTNTVISKYPLDQDFWESTIVEVKPSNLNKNAGQGLFLKKAVVKGQIVALFNGIRYLSSRNNCQDDSPEQCFDYRIRLNGDTDIDIPPAFTSLERYCATLGHKANHSFTPNAKWSRIEHPRFGLICAIKAMGDLPRGSEILVNYGMGMSDAPLWYKSLWVEHLRETKKYSNDQILDWCRRQYCHNGRLVDLPLE